MKRRPSSVVISGRKYRILYEKKPSDVDVFRREALWGQIDYWTRTIRVLDDGRDDTDVFQTILHEIIHGLVDGLKLRSLEHTREDEDKHKDLDVLSLALADVLVRNGWIEFK